MPAPAGTAAAPTQRSKSEKIFDPEATAQIARPTQAQKELSASGKSVKEAEENPVSKDVETSNQVDRSAVPKRADGVELLGEYEGSGFKDPRYLARRSDGSLIQLTQLLYAVLEGIDGERDLEEIAARASENFGKKVSADNVSTLIEKNLFSARIRTGTRWLPTEAEDEAGSAPRASFQIHCSP